MRRLAIGLGFLVLSLLAAASSGAVVGNGGKGGKEGRGDDRLTAKLTGFSEVPSISTTGRGSFSAEIENNSIKFKLRYSDLEGTAQAAHIHFAERHVNGGIVAFLCGSPKPACPASGTVTGTISAADIQAVPAQGIAAGEIDEVIRAMNAGAIYANVHTSTFPGGEIRGQVRGRGEGGDEN
jgi:CHRD domain